jgi:hypothetical protein
MFNNFNFHLTIKDKFTCELLVCGSMDHSVWQDKETAVAYRMENSHTPRITLIISYAVN